MSSMMVGRSLSPFWYADVESDDSGHWIPFVTLDYVEQWRGVTWDDRELAVEAALIKMAELQAAIAAGGGE